MPTGPLFLKGASKTSLSGKPTEESLQPPAVVGSGSSARSGLNEKSLAVVPDSCCGTVWQWLSPYGLGLGRATLCGTGHRSSRQADLEVESPPFHGPWADGVETALPLASHGWRATRKRSCETTDSDRQGTRSSWQALGCITGSEEEVGSRPHPSQRNGAVRHGMTRRLVVSSTVPDRNA